MPPVPWWRRSIAPAAEAVTLVVALGALGLWCSIPDTARLADQNPSSTAFIDLRRATAEAGGKPFTLHWQWRSVGSISRYLRAAVIYAEDYKFYRHDGVDWDAIEHAISADWNKGAMAIGGSTITQQLAKNLYLSPNRSVFRKLREALIAFSLEDHLSKQRILEIYLNVVEWGDGVFGAEAAARSWFHHSAQTLTPAEAIRLAIALPNPIARAPNVRDAELTKKSVRLVRLLRMQGLLDAAQERTALDELGAPDARVLPDREVAAQASSGEPPTPEPPVRRPESPPGGTELPVGNASPPSQESTGRPTPSSAGTEPTGTERPARAEPLAPDGSPPTGPSPSRPHPVPADPAPSPASEPTPADPAQPSPAGTTAPQTTP